MGSLSEGGRCGFEFLSHPPAWRRIWISVFHFLNDCFILPVIVQHGERHPSPLWNKQVSPALFFDMVPKDACTWERWGLQVGADPQGCACLFASAQVLDDWLDEARPITHVHCISSWLALCVCYHLRFIVPSAFSSWQITPCTGSLNLTVYLLFPGAFPFRSNVCPPPGISDPVKNQSLGSLWLIFFSLVPVLRHIILYVLCTVSLGS